MSGIILQFKRPANGGLQHGEIFARIGYAISGLPDEEIEAILELIEALGAEKHGLRPLGSGQGDG